MYSAPRSVLAVAAVFMSSLSGTAAFPQAVNFIGHAAAPLPLATLPLRRSPCASEPGRAVAAPYAATMANGDLSSPCDAPPGSVPSVNPCNPASPAKTGCPAPRDRVQEDLARMGKSGQKFCGRAKGFSKSCEPKTPVRRGSGKRIRIQRTSFERSALKWTARETSLSRNPKTQVT